MASFIDELVRVSNSIRKSTLNQPGLHNVALKAEGTAAPAVPAPKSDGQRPRADLFEQVLPMKEKSLVGKSSVGWLGPQEIVR